MVIDATINIIIIIRAKDAFFDIGYKEPQGYIVFLPNSLLKKNTNFCAKQTL